MYCCLQSVSVVIGCNIVQLSASEVFEVVLYKWTHYYY